VIPAAFTAAAALWLVLDVIGLLLLVASLLAIALKKGWNVHIDAEALKVGLKKIPLPVGCAVFALAFVVLISRELASELDKQGSDRCGTPNLAHVAAAADRQPEHGSVCLEESHTGVFFAGNYEVALGSITNGVVANAFPRASGESAPGHRFRIDCPIETPLRNGFQVGAREIAPQPAQSIEYEMQIESVGEHSVHVFAERHVFLEGRTQAKHEHGECLINGAPLQPVTSKRIEAGPR
jgi:hypothetical protein